MPRILLLIHLKGVGVQDIEVSVLILEWEKEILLKIGIRAERDIKMYKS